MALVPNPGLYIPLVFVDADKVEHRGTSWADLILQIARYRKRNHIEPGNPENEVLTQACAKYPDRCVEKSGPTKLPALVDDLNLRLLAWLVKMDESTRKLVTDGEARQRAEICKACPRQRDWRSKCGSCAASADALVKDMLAGRPAGYTKDLLGCLALSEDSRLSTWLEQPPVGDANLPVNCWRR